ncbi:MAG: ATP-binding protein [Rubrobacteraceae bacterium]
MTNPKPPSSSDGAGTGWRTLADFSLPSQPGNERQAMERVAESVHDLGLDGRNLERLKTAVAEATMNAMEHGNEYRAEAPVVIRVLASAEELSVFITDEGGDPVPAPDTQTPDLEAKLEGMQTPRGWGLFLIQNMVDEMHVTTDQSHHTVELVVRLKGGQDASETA